MELSPITKCFTSALLNKLNQLRKNISDLSPLLGRGGGAPWDSQSPARKLGLDKSNLLSAVECFLRGTGVGLCAPAPCWPCTVGAPRHVPPPLPGAVWAARVFREVREGMWWGYKGWREDPAPERWRTHKARAHHHEPWGGRRGGGCRCPSASRVGPSTALGGMLGRGDQGGLLGRGDMCP